MILDFDKILVTKMPNFYGGEKEMRAKMFTDELNRIMHVTLEKGASIGSHSHTDVSEIVYVLSGSGTVVLTVK